MPYTVFASEALKYSPEGTKLLVSNGYQVDYYSSFDHLMAQVENYDAVIGGGYWDKQAFARARRLKILARTGTGYDSVDIEAATDHGVAVTTTPGANASAVAEHAVALMLGITRNIYAYHRGLQQGIWEPTTTRELRGKTVGIIGLGSIGCRLVEMLSCFGVVPIAYDPMADETFARERQVVLLAMEPVLEQADIVSIHCPLTPQTRGLIGARQLAMLKPTAILINTSRGGVVDETALLKVLDEHRILGAGLDVFAEQPLTEASPLTRLDNVILTPHAASLTEEAFDDMGVAAAKSVVERLCGQRPDHLVNPEVRL